MRLCCNGGDHVEIDEVGLEELDTRDGAAQAVMGVVEVGRTSDVEF